MNPVQNRSFLGALAAAIKAFCMLFINAVDVADDAVGMAGKAVKVARERQTVDLAIDMRDYTRKAVNKAKLDAVQQELALREFVNGDAAKQALMDAAHEDIMKAVNAELALLHQQDAA